MLKITDLHVNYGNIRALKGVSLEVHEGELTTILGANGAGKTTLLTAICGLNKVTQGIIEFKGNEIQNLSTEKIVQQGISLCPEGRKVFPRNTVYENLKLGAYTRKDKEEVEKDIDKFFTMFPRLAERRNQQAGNLSGGEQQMLAICRALMSRPSLLLLDEPSMGLAPLIVQEVFDLIKELHNQGQTILLVEQNAFMALKVADRGYVLEVGNITLEDTVENLEKNPKVKESYLGG